MTIQKAQHRHLAELAKNNFVAYSGLMRSAFRVYQHLVIVNKVLADVARGLIARVIFAMPPRHGKSYTISELFPAWMIGRNPSIKVMQAAYGSELAEDFGRAVRDQLQSLLFREIFGFGLSPNVTAAKHFRTVAEGSYLAAGIGGGFTGFGANLFNIDDPIKTRREAESSTYRQGIVDWLQAVAYDRLEDFDDGRPGIMMVNATRWHENDMSGWIMKNLKSEGYLYIALPAITDADGERCLPRDPGARPLWLEKRTIEAYETRRLIVGGYEWDSKYQQNPTPPTGSIFDLEWFNRTDNPPRVAKVVQSWDTAEKDKLTSAYSTCGTFKVAAGRYYTTDVFRERLKYPALKRNCISLAERESPDAVLIEDKSSGIQLIQDLRAETSIPVIAIEPEGDKRIRAYGQSGIVEAGLCWLPNVAPWLPEFESELRSCPACDFWDQVDMFTQFLKWQRGKGDNLHFATTGKRASAGAAGPEIGAFARTG